MDDLTYIIGLGFSGADLVRAVILAFFLAVIFGTRRSVWALGLIALALDKFVWPIAAQALSGAEIHTIYASIGAMGETFLDDLGVYLVRYMGLVVMIAAFTGVRAWIHAGGFGRKAAA